MLTISLNMNIIITHIKRDKVPELRNKCVVQNYYSLYINFNTDKHNRK